MPSLLEALELKYGNSSGVGTTDCLTDEESETTKDALSVSIFIPKKSPRHLVPALLVLQDCGIESAGNDHDKLRRKCANVEELDLAQNKLSQWHEVFGILQHMPKIKFVNLSFNSLGESLQIKDGYYEHLKNLVLNGTRVSWSTVQGLVRLLHNVEELHLSLNEFQTVDLEHDYQHMSLKKLHFTGNPIEQWSEIVKLGYVFPNLESFVLAECPLRSLQCERFSDSELLNQNTPADITEPRSPADDENKNQQPEQKSDRSTSSHDPFRKLKFINLNGTLLSTWDDIDRLARFPALKSLRIQACPLFEVLIMFIMNN